MGRHLNIDQVIRQKLSKAILQIVWIQLFKNEIKTKLLNTN